MCHVQHRAAVERRDSPRVVVVPGRLVVARRGGPLVARDVPFQQRGEHRRHRAVVAAAREDARVRR
jgi:hypothetical protein